MGKVDLLDMQSPRHALAELVFLQLYMGVSFKWWYPQIIHFNRDFYYKPSILGYPHFWKHPDFVFVTFVTFHRLTMFLAIAEMFTVMKDSIMIKKQKLL